MKVGNDVYEVADSKSRGVELTWAQYQALSYEEQHNGTAYYITDMDAVYPVDHELNANSRNAVANDIVTTHILAMENVLGAKNLLPLKLADIKNESINTGTWSGNSYTNHGVTFTFAVNSNDYVIDIATSGTSTKAFNFTFAQHAEGFSKYSGMVLNGCPKVNNVSMYMLLNVSPYTEYAVDAGEGATITTIPDGSGVWFGININGTGVDMSNLHFKPMIRPAGTDPTYVPYSMTNEQLTERVEDLTSRVDRGYVDIMSDGIKTYGQLLSDLFTSEVRDRVIAYRLTAKIAIGGSVVAPFVGRNVSDHKVFFGASSLDSGGGAYICGIVLDDTSSSNCKWTYTYMNGTITDLSVIVPGSGEHIQIRY